MTILMQRMQEELVRRNYAATAIHSSLKAVEHFRNHVDTPIEEMPGTVARCCKISPC